MHRRRHGHRHDPRDVALTITRGVIDGLIAHARRQAPLECCGLLIGKGDVIDEHAPTRNLRSSEVAYEIDPREHIAIRKDARARGRVVLGAYHSHPRTAAVPSPTDIAEAHYDDDFLYVIVSLEKEPAIVRAYRLQHGLLKETPYSPV